MGFCGLNRSSAGPLPADGRLNAHNLSSVSMEPSQGNPFEERQRNKKEELFTLASDAWPMEPLGEKQRNNDTACVARPTCEDWATHLAPHGKDGGCTATDPLIVAEAQVDWNSRAAAVFPGPLLLHEAPKPLFRFASTLRYGIVNLGDSAVVVLESRGSSSTLRSHS